MAFDLPIGTATVFMEISGGTPAQRRNVAHVLVNRMRSGRWGETLAEVCLFPLQFSCWNTTDPNRRRMAATDENDPVLADCREALADALGGAADPTNGAMFYYAEGSPEPDWARGHQPCLNDGRHLFFNTVR